MGWQDEYITEIENPLRAEIERLRAALDAAINYINVLRDVSTEPHDRMVADAAFEEALNPLRDNQQTEINK